MSTWLIVLLLILGFLALSTLLALFLGRVIRLRDTRQPREDTTESGEQR